MFSSENCHDNTPAVCLFEKNSSTECNRRVDQTFLNLDVRTEKRGRSVESVYSGEKNPTHFWIKGATFKSIFKAGHN